MWNRRSRRTENLCQLVCIQPNATKPREKAQLPSDRAGNDESHATPEVAPQLQRIHLARVVTRLRQRSEVHKSPSLTCWLWRSWILHEEHDDWWAEEVLDYTPVLKYRHTIIEPSRDSQPFTTPELQSTCSKRRRLPSSILFTAPVSPMVAKPQQSPTV